MNDGLLAQLPAPVALPYGLLGRPTPVPMIDYRSVFNPRTIPGLAGWWDASESSTVTLNGTGVSSWADLSGNGRDAVQATAANQPTYTDKRNALNVISFDGAAQFLRGAWPVTITGQTTFAVVSMANVAGYGRVFTQTTTTNGTATGSLNLDYNITGNYIPMLRFSNNAQWASWKGNIAAGVNVSYSTWNVWLSVYSGSFIRNAIDNGTPLTSGSLGTINTSFHTFGIGASLPTNPGNTGAASGWFGGSIAEILSYTRALSASEIAAVSAYLKRKWATP